MLGPPSRDSLVRQIEEQVNPEQMPAIVNGVGLTSFSCVVGGQGGNATIIDYAGPDQLAVGDLVWVQPIPRDPFGRYRYISRRVQGASVKASNDPVTGTPIPPSVYTPITMSSVPAPVTTELSDHESRIEILETKPGHIIVDLDGVEYPTRSKLKFEGPIEIVDDFANDTTIVRVASSPASGLNYNANVGFNEAIYYDS